jgi:hypothetical protein
MPKQTLGDAPIELQYRVVMYKVGRIINRILNRTDQNKSGFILMVFPLNAHEGRCNYLSNARREDVVIMLKEQLKRFEGQPDIKGHA